MKTDKGLSEGIEKWPQGQATLKKRTGGRLNAEAEIKVLGFPTSPKKQLTARLSSQTEVLQAVMDKLNL